MARPKHYRELNRLMVTGKMHETIALGHDHMWGVKHGDDWVILCYEDAFKLTPSRVYRKYSRLFFATQKSAQNQAERLNKMFNSTEYKVAKI